MRTPTLPIVATTCFVITSAHAGGNVVTAELIPGASSANDMSPDGRYIVGERNIGGTYIFDTTTNVMTGLGPPATGAVAVSDDGTVVLGNMPNPEPGDDANVAAIWTQATGWQSIGYLGLCGSRSTGYELSADGSVAIGLSWNGCSARGFWWSEATGMLELENLANGNNRASVISSDGTVIGGFAQGSFSRTPAMWDENLVGTLLDPPNGDVVGEIQGISDDGTVLLGEWDGDAVRWTEGGGAEVIGSGQMIPGWTGIAMDIADNGTVVGFDILQTSRRAWIQENGTGQFREVGDFIAINGGTAPPGLSFQVCQAISTDGRRIIGHGAGTGGWMVTITPPCPGNTNDDDVVDFQDLLNLLASWGGCVDCPADFDGNDMVDFQDLLVLLASWGPCP